MYYICKFSETWSLYDSIKQSSRPLEKTEVDCLKNLFPSLLPEDKILSAITINSINPNKLTNLQIAEKSITAKKIPDSITRPNS